MRCTLDEEYLDIIDETEDDLDDSQDFKENQIEGYGVSPTFKESSDIYNWFWKVVRLDKPMRIVRVGNLNSQEIGLNSISVRDALNLHQLGKTFKHPTFGNYFAHLAKITSATSMSKKGWFMDLSISQKKVRERSRALTTYPSPQTKKKWKGIFNRNTPQTEV